MTPTAKALSRGCRTRSSWHFLHLSGKRYCHLALWRVLNMRYINPSPVCPNILTHRHTWTLATHKHICGYSCRKKQISDHKRQTGIVCTLRKALTGTRTEGNTSAVQSTQCRWWRKLLIHSQSDIHHTLQKGNLEGQLTGSSDRHTLWHLARRIEWWI